MKPETLQALKGSIAKWEAIVAGTGSNNGASDCPLCWRFRHYSEVGVRCDGGIDREPCPVLLRTGEHCCRSTPFEEYIRGTFVGATQRPGAAQAELDFLKSLLPAEA